MVLTPLLRFNWPNLVSQIKNQDPDIIYLANPFDSLDELIKLADNKLIIVSLTAANLSGGFLKLLQFCQTPAMIIERLVLILRQNLAARVCGACAQTQKLDYKILAQLHNKFELEDTKNLSRLNHTQGAGCRHCNYSGLNGQIGLYELLPLDRILKNKLLKNHSLAKRRQLINGALTQTLTEDAWQKTFSGLIPVSELLNL